MSEPEQIKKPLVERILDEWMQDAKMDPTEPGNELLKISNLHARYVRYLTGYSSKLKTTQMELARMKKLKFDYYNGRLTQEELAKYQWKQMKFLLKGDMLIYLEADEDIQAIQRKIITYEETVDLCKSILKQLEQRSYSLKSYIDWQKLQAGL